MAQKSFSEEYPEGRWVTIKDQSSLLQSQRTAGNFKYALTDEQVAYAGERAQVGTVYERFGDFLVTMYGVPGFWRVQDIELEEGIADPIDYTHAEALAAKHKNAHRS